MIGTISTDGAVESMPADRPVRTKIIQDFTVRAFRIKQQFRLRRNALRRSAPAATQIAPFKVIDPAMPRTVLAVGPTLSKNSHDSTSSPAKRRTYYLYREMMLTLSHQRTHPFLSPFLSMELYSRRHNLSSISIVIYVSLFLQFVILFEYSPLYDIIFDSIRQ